MLVRWNLTVCSATQSSFEIASFERPRATARMIPSSRSVSPASFAARSPGSSVMPAVVKTFPSRACRRAPARSSGSIDLTMYAFAPRFNAVWISSGSCETDSIATFMSGNSFRIFVRQVRPSICGMRRSSSTRSGFSLRMSGRTWRAVHRFPDDVEAAGPFQSLLRSLDHQPMVVRNQDSHATLTITVASAFNRHPKGGCLPLSITDNECGAKESSSTFRIHRAL